MTKRPRAVLFAAGVHLVATVVMTWPYLNWSALGTSIHVGDARFIAWVMGWTSHAWLNGLPVFDANVFFPAPQSLIYNDPLFGLSIFALPILAVSRNPILAYNVLTFLAFLLNGLAMQVLVRRFTSDAWAGVVAGFIYAFSFYMMLHGHGHLSQIWVWLLPLSLWAFDRWREQATWRRAALWGALLLLQVLSSWYLAVIALVGTMVVVVWHLPGLWRDHPRVRLAQLGVVAAVSGLILWPLASPYLHQVLDTTALDLRGNSADWASYIVPPLNTLVGQSWGSRFGVAPREIWGEQTLFLGCVTMALALGGCGVLVRRRGDVRAWPFLGVAAVGVLMSFGPSDGTGWPSLFDLIRGLPGVGGIRSPGRFAILVLLGVAVLAGCAVAGARRRWGRRAEVAIVLLVPIMLAEWYVVDFPAGRPPRVAVPAIYRHPAIADARAIASLPDYRQTPRWFEGADYFLYSTVHWRPIVNGFGRSEPEGFPRIISYTRAFPGPNNARLMRELGVDLIVFHAAGYGADAQVIIEDAQRLADYELVARDGDDYLFRVRRLP